MSHMTEQDIIDNEEVFLLFDTNGDRKIYASQLGEVLRAMGQNPTEARVRKCGFSNDPDKRISYEQFVPILHDVAKNKDHSSCEDFVDGFRVFDKEANGTISTAELRHLLTHLGEKLRDDEVELLLAGLEDAQGNINYEEFVRMVMSG
ncbi:myosin-2 essential light chain-like [Lineus longissimus]|uniref:myosin-2 essential light chain-like n=1 Tax=Lineus longissimus TaxID=88925 RepID=UPI002B4EFA63